MMKRTIKFFLSLLFIFNVTAFAHTATVLNSGTNPYKKIRLTPEIYNRANSNLSDILIQDENGETVPYFIHSNNENSSKENIEYPMTLINSYLKEDKFYFDYKISELPRGDVVATSIAFATNNTNFAKEALLYGSYDNVNWEIVKEDSLYFVDGNMKLEIQFNKPQKYTYYRLQLANNLEKIYFQTVHLNYSVTTYEKSYFYETITPQFAVEEKEKETYIYLKDLKNLKIDAIIIESDSMFKRRIYVKQLDVTSEIYQLTFQNTTYKDTNINLKGKKITDDVAVLIIQNYDDKPITVKGISVRYLADEVIFKDNGSLNYNLFFRKDETKTAPVYDIASYKNEILKGNIDNLKIQEIKIEQEKEEPKGYNEKAIFNIVIIFVTLLLGILILLKLRKKS